MLIKAADEDEALRFAEQEAGRYAADSGLEEGCSYTGFVNVFHLFETEVGHGTEVYSLMRSSDLDEKKYLDVFYDSGTEHCRS